MLKQLVLASHNPGKLRELQALLEPLGCAVLSAADCSLSEPEETGRTFEENAVLKAESASNILNLPALADDSGFAVEALNGQPGIYSARWAGPGKNFGQAMEKVWLAWKGMGTYNTRAAFHCVLALAIPGQETVTFSGSIEGNVCWPPRGDNGFGYDPMFIPDGSDRTYGEMLPAEKSASNHRARAFTQLTRHLAK